MSEYIMTPGARLDIGPGGKPFESLGACCKGCANGTSLGATATDKALVPNTFAATPTNVASSIPVSAYLAAAGLGVVGLVVYLRRRKRR